MPVPLQHRRQPSTFNPQILKDSNTEVGLAIGDSGLRQSILIPRRQAAPDNAVRLGIDKKLSNELIPQSVIDARIARGTLQASLYILCA